MKNCSLYGKRPGQSGLENQRSLKITKGKAGASFKKGK